MASERRNFGAYGWGAKYLGPPVAVIALFFGVPDIPQSIAAAKNEGSPGTFTSKRSDCNWKRTSCTYYGEFVSKDGTVTLNDVFLDAGVDRVGVSVPAQYFENDDNKVYEPNSRDWVFLGLVLVGSVAFLMGWSWVVLRPWIRKRKS